MEGIHRERHSPQAPTHDEVLEAFTRIAGGRTVHIDEPITSPEGGLALLTMTVTNADGTHEEFQYSNEEGSPLIVVTDIAKDGTIEKPMVLAEYVHGAWVLKEGVGKNPAV